MATASNPSTPTSSRSSIRSMDEYKQHLDVAANRHVRRRRSWADQNEAYQSLPHGKTYAVLAAEGIVARARQILEQDDASRPSSINSREE